MEFMISGSPLLYSFVTGTVAVAAAPVDGAVDGVTLPILID